MMMKLFGWTTDETTSPDTDPDSEAGDQEYQELMDELHYEEEFGE
jgi:hypothetical protein